MCVTVVPHSEGAPAERRERGPRPASRVLVVGEEREIKDFKGEREGEISLDRAYNETHARRRGSTRRRVYVLECSWPGCPRQ